MTRHGALWPRARRVGPTQVVDGSKHVLVEFFAPCTSRALNRAMGAR